MMGQKNYTAAELDDLTEEERAGLLDPELEEDEGGDASEEDTQAQKAVEGSTDAADAESTDDNAENNIGEDDADPQDAAEAPDQEEKTGDQEGDVNGQAEAEAEPEAADRKSEDRAHAPLPNWKAPENYDQKLKDIQAEQDQIDQKFDDGELTAQELRQQQRGLLERERALRDNKLKAEMSEETRLDAWTNAFVPEFLDQHEAYKTSNARFNALDATVRQLQQKAASEGKDHLHPSILQRAHKIVEDDLGPSHGKKPEPPADNPTQEGAPKPKDKRTIPPTLAKVPASDINETDDGGKFAHLDRLAERDGEAYEEAMAKMSPDELNDYLAR